jgi:hypothetical protein
MVDDLAPVNSDPNAAVEQWVTMPQDSWNSTEARVRQAVPVRDDFVQIPFPRIAATSDRPMTAAVESYEREAAIVDPRLSQEVTLQQKATALSDLCERLRADTGIQLTAGPSVADEKVTLFCEKQPLRDVMRQLSRPFGYTWIRSGKAGEYKYELVQDLRSQLLEEELRNRDRNAALLALGQEIDRYRPYLNLSPDEALARSKTAPPADKKLLEQLAGVGWGVIQMYFRLSAQQFGVLRSGQSLTFSAEPEPGQQPLPPDMARGVLQTFRGLRIFKSPHVDIGFDFTSDPTDPRSVSATVSPVARASVSLSIQQNELGQFGLNGQSGVSVGGKLGRDGIRPGLSGGSGAYAVGISAAVQRPENGATNVKLAHDAALRSRVTFQPQSSCGGVSGPFPNPTPLLTAVSGQPSVEKKVTMADVLEALHHATGRPIVADYYTRLYKPEDVSVRKQPLFDALNQVADTMRLRWNKEGGWLQFRSSSYYDDRLKEVPNRLLTRWAAVRRQHGMLPLDELIEMAQLPDAELDAAEMAEGARECFGLEEWDLARNGNLRPQLRYLATFTPEQRQLAMSAEGLAFTRMSLQQQQQYLANGIVQPLESLEDLAGAVLRVEYTQPGEFQWQPPESWLWWAWPIEPGPQGRRAFMPPLRARTREAVIQAVRRIEPQVREGLLKMFRYGLQPPGDNLHPEEADRWLQGAEIVPTRLDLTIAYIPGTSNRLLICQVSRNGIRRNKPG